MIQRNCKNCGAPLEHSYNHKCKYCGTLYDFNEPEENTVEVKPEDLVDINLREANFMPIANSLLLIFDGYKLAKPKVFEYNGENNYISKVEEYINPPKCGFCVEVPLLEIGKHGIPYILWRIETTGIRPREWERIKGQLIENETIKRVCGGFYE